MDDTMVDVSEAMDEQVDADNVKAAQEADLIDGGRYKAQIESCEGAKADKEYFDEEQKNRNPFYGKMIYNLRLRLSAKRDGKKSTDPWQTLERPRVIFQRVTNASVLDRRGELSIESKLFGQMAGIAAAALGTSLMVSNVLEYFKDNAFEINITLSPEKDDEKTGAHYDARNWTRGIKGYRE